MRRFSRKFLLNLESDLMSSVWAAESEFGGDRSDELAGLGQVIDWVLKQQGMKRPPPPKPWRKVPPPPDPYPTQALDPNPEGWALVPWEATVKD